MSIAHKHSLKKNEKQKTLETENETYVRSPTIPPPEKTTDLQCNPLITLYFIVSGIFCYLLDFEGIARPPNSTINF